MKNDDNKRSNELSFPSRKSPRADFHDYSGGDYFITICTKNKSHYFGEITNGQMRLSPLGEFTTNAIDSLHSHYPYAEVRVSIVMPNHLHMIIHIDTEEKNTRLPKQRTALSGKHKKTDGSEPPAKMRLEPASVRLIYPDKRSNLSWGSALFAARLGIRSFVTGRSRTTTGAAIHDFRERAHVAIDRVDKTRNFICWLNNSVRVDDSGDLVIKSRCLVDQIRRTEIAHCRMGGRLLCPQLKSLIKSLIGRLQSVDIRLKTKGRDGCRVRRVTQHADHPPNLESLLRVLMKTYLLVA